MNLSPQPPSSEESEQLSAPHSSEETTQSISGTPGVVSNEAEQEQQPPATPSESEPFTEETERQAASSAEPGEGQPTTLDEHNIFTADGIEDSTLDDEDETLASDPDDEDEDLNDEDEDLDDENDGSAPSQSTRSGIFIQTKVLIAAVSAVVLVALLVALLIFVNRPKDPPTDWVASYTPPAGASSVNKILYYLHWTNQNGKLSGQLQLAANANGTTQSVTGSATGLYNRDNHIIYVVVTINGQPATLTGTINSNNDTLTLNGAGAPDQSSQIVFHTGTANDYQQQTKKLGSSSK